MRRAEFTPLTQSPRIVCDLADHLPAYAQPDHIGIDFGALDRAAVWGGFRRRVHVKDISSYAPPPVKYNDLGEAMLSTVDVDIVGDRSDSRNLWRARAGLVLNIHTPYITDAIIREGLDRSNPAVWASHIDSLLATGLRQGARKHLVGRPFPVFEGALTLSESASFVITPLLMALLHGPGFDMALIEGFQVGGTLVSVNATRAIYYMLSHEPMSEACFSLVPFQHFDRLAVVAALTKWRTFAKAI